MKTPKEYEQIIKKIIFNNWRTVPYFENESDSEPLYHKIIIYYGEYTVVFNGKDTDKIPDALNYLFDKVMEIEDENPPQD